MNLQHLRYFLAVMETGSVSRAADGLGITQPTLSLALKRLEAEFGTRLFTPHGRGIKPLPAARHLEERARLAVRALADARRDLAGLASGGLKVGVLPSLAAPWLPRLISCRTGGFEIVEAAPDELERQLHSGALDLALTVSPLREGVVRKVLLREPYALFVGPLHPFAGRRSVRLPELDGQPFVLRQSCERLGNGRRLLLAAGGRLKLVAKTTQEATAAALVTSDVGCTLAPWSWHCSGARRVGVDGLGLERAVILAWKKATVHAASIADIARKLLTLGPGGPNRAG
ncbi:LysR family transcriptional regulator [Bradyrhizobium sp. WD16]|uniref:LysR family transcriptional regulator n=1 Tax=Bradyrhizobium sp. WD16 TaxID=1521768 RepID=UPI0020A24E24|nr:LysR family transcriptional regulator [Bradyrhizobium sp. WD16]UTD28115.1 LysR family transcriptional regulator [Bradyrhizobium sp. WD16]